MENYCEWEYERCGDVRTRRKNSCGKLIAKCEKSQRKAPMWHKIMNARIKCLDDWALAENKALPRMFENTNQSAIDKSKLLKSKLNTIEKLQEDWDDDLITEEFVENELNRVGYGFRSHNSNNLTKEKIKYE